jgi:hypothetical protein
MMFLLFRSAIFRIKQLIEVTVRKARSWTNTVLGTQRFRATR